MASILVFGALLSATYLGEIPALGYLVARFVAITASSVGTRLPSAGAGDSGAVDSGALIYRRDPADVLRRPQASTTATTRRTAGSRCTVEAAHSQL